MEVLIGIAGVSRAHDHAEDILDVALFQSIAHRGTDEVGMAACVHVLARHEVVGVGVAPAPDDVVDAGSVAVEAICYGTLGDRRERPQVEACSTRACPPSGAFACICLVLLA